MSQKILKFPEGFFWGSAASAYQVEGGIYNNDWADFCRAGKINDGSMCQLGPDHYHLYEKDFDIAENLNQNAHRFSIEWSRIEPREGHFDKKEIEHYRKVLRALKKRGLEPFVTIYHWPVPKWFAKKGHWHGNRDAVKDFTRYGEYVARELCNEVKYWVTINEPAIYTLNSFFTGVWPPEKKSIFTAKKVYDKLIKSHKILYELIHGYYPSGKVEVGVAKNNTYFEAYQNKWMNKAVKKWADHFWNQYFLEEIRRYQDFIGLNHYFHNRIKFNWLRPSKSFNQNENKETTDMGWEIYPPAIYHCLKDLKKYNLPVYIFENGLADAEDKKRADYIRNYLRYVHRAIQEGVDVRGYFYWSLLDNFEWKEGYSKRFGLVDINYRTLERHIRPSAKVYAKICRQNQLVL